jgi:hypothetical protein
VWQSRNRDRIATETYRDENHKAAKLMLNHGRARELAVSFDNPIGLLGIRARLPLRADQLHEVPVVALALRQAGRAGDANRLLSEAERMMDAVYRRGRVPFRFDADAAAVSATQGRSGSALAKLERAMDRGWTHSGNTDLRDIGDEPAFLTLRGHPRFERLRARLAAHRVRERREIAQLRI